LTISLVGTASAGDAGTATSTTVTLPAGITVNDQILVAITTQSDLTVTTPSGYTVVGTYPAGTASKTIVYRRTAAGSETSVTLSYSGLRQKSIVAAVYRGVDPTNPIDVSSSASAVNATSVTAPSVTTTAVNDRLVLFEGANGNALPVTWNAPAGMTDQVHYSGLPLSAAALADQTLGAAGATGTRTATTSSTPSSLADLTAVMLALRPDQDVFYYHQDQLGSTRALTDRAGAVVATYTYDPYGNLTASTGTVTTPFGYAGQYTDAESGLIYLRVRYYDPSTAQFLTVDPAYAQTQSRYGYVDGDPLNLMDPSGETPLVLYDIDRPAFSEPAAEADLYWKVWAAGGSPIFHPTTWLDSYGRIPDLQWSSPFGGSTIAEVKAGNGGTAGSDVIAQ